MAPIPLPEPRRLGTIHVERNLDLVGKLYQRSIHPAARTVATGGRLTAPLVVDLLSVKGGKPAQYDLPLHFAGQIIDAGFPLQSNVGARPVLGTEAGYQHLWVDATGTPDAANARLTWILSLIHI